MTNNIYGIDADKPITAFMIRDAIVTCFYKAHCVETGLNPDKKSPANQEYCRSIIRKFFKDTNGDFDNPDKKSIEEVLKALVKFSENFRDSSIIEKHYNEIMILMGKLEE